MSSSVHRYKNLTPYPESLEDLADSQRKSVRGTLADILTIEVAEAELLAGQYPQDAIALHAAVTSDVAEQGDHAREWRGSTMAILPRRYWVPADGEQPPYYVGANKYSSLRYITTQEADTQKGLQPFTNRRALYRAIIEGISLRAWERFKPLLEWDDAPILGRLRVSLHPQLEDMAIRNLLTAVERMFDFEYYRCEQTYREKHQLSPLYPTPPETLVNCAKRAADAVHLQLASRNVTDYPSWEPQDAGYIEEGAEPKTGDIGQQCHLTIKVLCNIAANRVLLERARLAELYGPAADANTALLTVMNEKGICEAPTSCRYTWEEIRILLSQWFGPEGTLAAVPYIAKRHLKGQDWDVLIWQARRVQYQFTRTRGADASYQHISRYSRFLFALAVVACHFAGIDLVDDLDGSKKKVFPPRKMGLSARKAPLSGSGMALLTAMYGQLFYGNCDQVLSVSGVQKYAEAFRQRHAYCQELLFNVFKRLTPSQLLQLDYVVDRFVQQHEQALKEPFRKRFLAADRHTRVVKAMYFVYNGPELGDEACYELD